MRTKIHVCFLKVASFNVIEIALFFYCYINKDSKIHYVCFLIVGAYKYMSKDAPTIRWPCRGSLLYLYIDVTHSGARSNGD